MSNIDTSLLLSLDQLRDLCFTVDVHVGTTSFTKANGTGESFINKDAIPEGALANAGSKHLLGKGHPNVAKLNEVKTAARRCCETYGTKRGDGRFDIPRSLWPAARGELLALRDDYLDNLKALLGTYRNDIFQYATTIESVNPDWAALIRENCPTEAQLREKLVFTIDATVTIDAADEAGLNGVSPTAARLMAYPVQIAREIAYAVSTRLKSMSEGSKPDAIRNVLSDISMKLGGFPINPRLISLKAMVDEVIGRMPYGNKFDGADPSHRASLRELLGLRATLMNPNEMLGEQKVWISNDAFSEFDSITETEPETASTETAVVSDMAVLGAVETVEAPAETTNAMPASLVILEGDDDEAGDWGDWAAAA